MSKISDSHGGVKGEVDFNFLGDLCISQRMLYDIQLMHLRVSIDDIYTLLGDSHMKVGYRIVLPISQTTHQWFGIFRESSNDALHNVGLNVTRLLQYFFLHGVKELLGLH